MTLRKSLASTPHQKKNKIVESMYNKLGFIEKDSNSENQTFILKTEDYKLINTKIGENNDC